MQTCWQKSIKQPPLVVILAQWRDFMSKGLHWQKPNLDIVATLHTELSNYGAAETELIRLASLATDICKARIGSVLD